jgi:hypothetical protein
MHGFMIKFLIVSTFLLREGESLESPRLMSEIKTEYTSGKYRCIILFDSPDRYDEATFPFAKVYKMTVSKNETLKSLAAAVVPICMQISIVEDVDCLFTLLYSNAAAVGQFEDGSIDNCEICLKRFSNDTAVDAL